MTDTAPKRRGRRRKDAIPDAIPEDPREALANWWRDRMEKIEREHQQRIDLLRTVGEHPSPIFSRQVKMFGALGIPKALAAKLLGIGIRVLESHYGEDYEIGAGEVLASVAANMIRIGTSMDDPANAKVGMDILSRRGGQEWRPPAQKLQVEDDREQPKNVIDTSNWPPEKREQLRQMLLEQIDRGVTGGTLLQSESDSEECPST